MFLTIFSFIWSTPQLIFSSVSWHHTVAEKFHYVSASITPLLKAFLCFSFWTIKMMALLVFILKSHTWFLFQFVLMLRSIFIWPEFFFQNLNHFMRIMEIILKLHISNVLFKTLYYIQGIKYTCFKNHIKKNLFSESQQKLISYVLPYVCVYCRIIIKTFPTILH